jgi:hypothetical protein
VRRDVRGLARGQWRGRGGRGILRGNLAGAGMERWIIIGAVLAIFASLGVAGWYFQPHTQDTAICANAEARCGEERHF